MAALVSPKISERIKERFPEAVVATHQFCGDDTVVIHRDFLKEIAAYLKEEPTCAFNLLSDLTAVDYLKYPERPKDQVPPGPTSRFEVVYHFFSMDHGMRLRVKVPVGESDPVVDTLSDLWKTANWFEREVWDMFGIKFKGHPNLKRLLLYEEFSGHPLRKDYPVNKRQPLIGPVN